MPQRFDLILCDVDGCLISEKPGPFDLDALAWLAAHNRDAAARRDRPIVSLCTGRPQPFAEAMCRLLHNLTVPCICENGVWLYHPGENRYAIDPAITAEHRAAVGDFAAWALTTYGGRGVTVQPGKTASVSLTHDDPAYLHAIRPEIEGQVSNRRWPIRISMTARYINCDLTHISKGTGVRQLLKVMNLSPQRVAMIGDTSGDLLAAAEVGFFACPANATDDVKQRAGYVASEVETRGVVEIVKRLV